MRETRSMPDVLAAQLRDIEADGLLRRLRTVNSADGVTVDCDGKKCVSFASNDYLGLSRHPALKAAAIEAVERFGAGAGASRSISGSLPPHEELETLLAEWKGAEAALAFSTGHAAATGTIPSLVGKGDIVILDRLAHACLVDGARASGATLRVFRHNDCNDLERILHWADSQRDTGDARILVVTESVFSMDGDRSPLREIVALKERFGAWLLLDEAHAVGWLGPQGAGLAAELGIADRVEVQMGTLGKAVGAAGGYIAGARALADLLVNRARSFIFSTAPVPAQAAAAAAGIRVIRSDEGAALARKLTSVVGQLHARRGNPAVMRSPIVPVAVGDERRALIVAEAMRVRGFWTPAVRFPTVARKQARLRLSFSAAHTEAQVDTLARALDEALVQPIAAA
jgi:8-amino-7-oxononanoate synthase